MTPQTPPVIALKAGSAILACATVITVVTVIGGKAVIRGDTVNEVTDAKASVD